MFESDKKRLCELTRSRALVAGSVHVLKKTNRDVVVEVTAYALLAGCLLLVTAIGLFIGLGPGYSEASVCLGSERDQKNVVDVYFVKHENRTWTHDELCNIEAAARLYPEYNLTVINLRKKSEPNKVEDYDSPLNKVLDNISLHSKATLLGAKSSGIELEKKLSEISNIHFTDTDVDQFFLGTILSNKVRDLTSDEIELAGKFQVIWDSPGISLDPIAVHQLESLRNHSKKSETDAIASIQINNDLQAASVPCQSFIGSVIAEMSSRNISRDRRSVIQRALNNQCTSTSNSCKSVRKVSPVAEKHNNLPYCPTTRATAEDAIK